MGETQGVISWLLSGGGRRGFGRKSAPRRVARLWDRQATKDFSRDFNLRTWSGIAQVHENHNALITGERGYYWITYVRDQYFPGGKAGDTLSLGCGEGRFDRILKNCGFCFNSFTGVDLSTKSIALAKEEANKISLSPKTLYITADLNEYRPQSGSFDFIYFFQSLHHIEALDELLRACAQALRPGGLLMVNDFVGPSRFQWTKTQVEMANDLLQVLPEKLRHDLCSPFFRLKTQVNRRTVAEMIAGDPSEAVRSGEIEPLLRKWFEIIEEKPWGGTLNNLVFENISGNFDNENAYHRAIIELLIRLENVVIEAGILPSDFKFFMAKPGMMEQNTG